MKKKVQELAFIVSQPFHNTIFVDVRIGKRTVNALISENGRNNTYSVTDYDYNDACAIVPRQTDKIVTDVSSKPDTLGIIGLAASSKKLLVQYTDAKTHKARVKTFDIPVQIADCLNGRL